MIDFETWRRNMVSNQLRPNKVTDERVLAAMGSVPRELFVRPEHRGVAYVDEDIPLGQGRVLMEPMVLARLLQAAEIEADDVVLDIGCGTGYTAAVCAGIAATVVAVENDSVLAGDAAQTLSDLGADNVVVVESPLRDGYPTQAPYDVILFSGAVPEIPDTILAQLGDGGRLCAIVVPADAAPYAALALNSGGKPTVRKLFEAAVPVLSGFEREADFVF